MHWQQVSTELLRALRGHRSQRATARRLGFQGNVIGNWEAGRRFPTLGLTLWAAGRLGADPHAALATFLPAHAAGLSFATPEQADLHVARWLSGLRGTTPLLTLADRAGVSRHALSRWLSGDTRPRLPDALSLVDVLTGRVSDLLAALVPIDTLPTLQELHQRRDNARALASTEPWSSAVLRMTETLGFQRQPYTAGWIASRLGIALETELRCLARLCEAGVIRFEEGTYRAGAPISVQAQGEALTRIRRHWLEQTLIRAEAPLPGDLFSFAVCSLSRADLLKLRALHRRTFTEMRATVAASTPTETVALLQMQILEWPVDQGD